ncbi:MAG: chitosanase [Bacteroidota bacterium]|nr:chitosanase [Bacteroidota bacterium]
MELSPKIMSLIREVLDAFDAGMVKANYDQVGVYDEGPGREKVISYGRPQVTELYGLNKLVENYVDANGVYSQELKPYIPKIGNEPLWREQNFLSLLSEAGKSDPIMRQLQNEFYEMQLLFPALKWAQSNGFALPLSALIICDSFTHSGGMPATLVVQVKEALPKQGGDEMTWMIVYVEKRRKWLEKLPGGYRKKNQLRMDFLQNEIKRKNWMLEVLPLVVGDAVIE